MSLPVWPSIADPDWGTEEETIHPQKRTPFEGNYVQSRPAATRSRAKWPLGWKLLPESEYQTLLTFFNTNLGGMFTWTHPISGTSYTCRFSGDALTGRWSLGSWRRDVRCPIEEV